jgi:type IV pilus assembly protein PilF
MRQGKMAMAQSPFGPTVKFSRVHAALLAASGVLIVMVCTSCVSTRPAPIAPAQSGTGISGPDKNAASRINVQLGFNYLRQGDLATAQEKLERALKEDPDYPTAHSAMALLDERLGKVKDAEREYRRALSLSNRAPAELNSYGVFLCSHGRADEGVRAFEEAAGNPIYNTPWAAYTNAGVCLQGVHRYTDAMAQYERALQSNPGFADAALHAADLDFSDHRYAEGRLRIDLYLLSHRPTPDLLLLGWRISSTQNDPVGQSRYGGRLAKEFPDSTQAHELALAMAARGR